MEEQATDVPTQESDGEVPLKFRSQTQGGCAYSFISSSLSSIAIGVFLGLAETLIDFYIQTDQPEKLLQVFLVIVTIFGGVLLAYRFYKRQGRSRRDLISAMAVRESDLLGKFDQEFRVLLDEGVYGRRSNVSSQYAD